MHRIVRVQIDDHRFAEPNPPYHRNGRDAGYLEVMFGWLKDLGRRDPERTAERAQQRADRKARRGRKHVDVERGAAHLDAEAQHYSSRHGGNVGGNIGSGPFGG
jgi:hypothetical protein